ncbi:MAG: hypothetical protein DI535_01335 [Citrobacter freundii]|nr:MAG: hypothetical protein DI535_01335 [Citrobacter freundii]
MEFRRNSWYLKSYACRRFHSFASQMTRITCLYRKFICEIPCRINYIAEEMNNNLPGKDRQNLRDLRELAPIDQKTCQHMAV